VSAELWQPGYRKLELCFKDAFANKVLYLLSITGQVKDCLGNTADTGPSGNFALPGIIEYNDLVINEVLFNPVSGGEDFVELYNRSDKVLDLADLRIATRDEDSLKLVSICLVSNEGYLVFPEQYLVISTDQQVIKAHYYTSNPEGFVDIEDMPAYNDDQGYVVLLDQSLQVVDEFKYDESMHFPLLNDPEGVSLERVNYDRVTNEEGNWHSASQESGFATPAYINSQYSENITSENEIYIENELFSPDNDGYRDQLEIAYRFADPGYVATVTVFDIAGRLQLYLMQNELLGTEGIITWDGKITGGGIAKTGMYVILIEVFNKNGEVKSYKEVCVLAKH
jgi:hypothetical protein